MLIDYKLYPYRGGPAIDWTRQLVTGWHYKREFAAYRVRDRYRAALMRLGDLEPRRLREFVHKANCQPSGFGTGPKLNRCHDRLICPWCFVRDRFLPVFYDIYNLTKLSLHLELAAWSEPIYNDDPSTWFATSRAAGPHIQNGAIYTAQVAMYDYIEAFESTGMRRVTIQLLPCGYETPSDAVLDVPAGGRVRRSFTRNRWPMTRVFRNMFHPNWRHVFREDSLSNYLYYSDICSGVRLLRVSVQSVYRDLLKEDLDETDLSAATQKVRQRHRSPAKPRSLGELGRVQPWMGE